MASSEIESGGNEGSCGCSDVVVDQISLLSLKEKTSEVSKPDEVVPSAESSRKCDEDDREVALNKSPTSAWTCLEDYKRFSESILWTFMMNFYGTWAIS
mmetsp:Transcript_61267/g.181208  ORF Transcript_61267/g.181208 Transcript_61267/m.181208 type:complete len:99 (-) Transcript_61267:1851-2147(-)